MRQMLFLDTFFFLVVMDQHPLTKYLLSIFYFPANHFHVHMKAHREVSNQHETSSLNTHALNWRYVNMILLKKLPESPRLRNLLKSLEGRQALQIHRRNTVISDSPFALPLSLSYTAPQPTGV